MARKPTLEDCQRLVTIARDAALKAEAALDDLHGRPGDWPEVTKKEVGTYLWAASVEIKQSREKGLEKAVETIDEAVYWFRHMSLTPEERYGPNRPGRHSERRCTCRKR